MAICRLLIHDSLMAGVKVLNTAVKNVGRPDLPGARGQLHPGTPPLRRVPQVTEPRRPLGPGPAALSGHHSLVLLPRELQLDAAAVGRPDFLLLLQDEPLQACCPIVGHRLVQVLGGTHARVGVGGPKQAVLQPGPCPRALGERAADERPPRPGLHGAGQPRTRRLLESAPNEVTPAQSHPTGNGRKHTRTGLVVTPRRTCRRRHGTRNRVGSRGSEVTW